MRNMILLAVGAVSALLVFAGFSEAYDSPAYRDSVRAVQFSPGFDNDEFGGGFDNDVYGGDLDNDEFGGGLGGGFGEQGFYGESPFGEGETYPGPLYGWRGEGFGREEEEEGEPEGFGEGRFGYPGPEGEGFAGQAPEFGGGEGGEEEEEEEEGRR